MENKVSSSFPPSLFLSSLPDTLSLQGPPSIGSGDLSSNFYGKALSKTTFPTSLTTSLNPDCGPISSPTTRSSSKQEIKS